MIVGCYTLFLYCANRPMEGEDTCKAPNYPYGPAEYTGSTEAWCKRKARKHGWKFSKGDATCPKCNAKDQGNPD